MRQTNYTALLKVSRCLAIVLGVFTLMMWAIDIGPQVWIDYYSWCRRLTVGTLTLATIAAIFYGIVRAKSPPQKMARWKRIVVRVMFWLLIPLGAIAMTEGRVYHVKATQRAAQRQEFLARDGYYYNPYWDRRLVCDLLGWACFGSWILWTYLALIAQVSDFTTRKFALKGKR